MRNISLIILLASLAFLLGACAEKERAEEVPDVKPAEEAGERVEGGFSHIQMEEEKVVLKIEGDSATGLDEERITIENPRVERVFYKEDKQNSMELEARTGIWNENSGLVEVEREVKGIVRFGEEIVIEHADKMAYEPEEHLLTLSGEVKIRQVRSVLRADKITIYLDEEDKEIVRVIAEGGVSGTIFPEELKR